MVIKSQMVKGFLDGFILAILLKEKLTTSEIIQRINKKGYYQITEGTMYPLMLRLENNQLVMSNRVQNVKGPSLKVYEITNEGIEALNAIIESWQEFKTLADAILKGR